MKILFVFFLFFIIWGQTFHAQTQINLKDQALLTINKAVDFFYSINSHGGYVYYVTPDLSQRWGESPADEHTIEVQPPGTPAVGMSFLRAFMLTQNPAALKAARDAAFALIRGQNDLGGWQHTIHVGRPKGNYVSFDDNQTQGVIRFLMALDQHIKDDSLTAAIDKALRMMMNSQLGNGGWPHQYPQRGNYHDYATFNDHGINDCIQVMLDACRFYEKEEYRESLDKAGRFVIISQIAPPQPGWAQQYNEFLQPAWARSFEPPSVCTLVTVNNLNTLIDLYLFTERSEYLEPIPDALRWLEEIRLPNGKWARFVELYTNKALYYDRDRIRVNSVDELHIERRTGYGYEVDLNDRLAATKARYNEVFSLKAKAYLQKLNAPLSAELVQKKKQGMTPEIIKIINSLDEQGRWITKNDRYKKPIVGQRWNGEFEVQDRISSAVFNRNIDMLCRFIELDQIRSN